MFKLVFQIFLVISFFHVLTFAFNFCPLLLLTANYCDVYKCTFVAAFNKLYCYCIVVLYYFLYDFNNNNNNNIQDNVYDAVSMAEPLREFTRFI